MTDKKIVGVVEFHSFDDDPNIGSQINEWLQKYPEVTIIDSKYQVVSYIENNTLKFATFALVFFHEPETPSARPVVGINRATTQRMQALPNLKGKR
jgi:hypothetical protein